MISTSTRFSPAWVPDDTDYYASLFCFAYFHPVDQGNWYRRHCTENYCASPKAILILHKMFIRDWCETILTYFGYPTKHRNCAKQRGDARDLEARSTRTRTYGDLILMIAGSRRLLRLALLFFPNNIVVIIIELFSKRNNFRRFV